MTGQKRSAWQMLARPQAAGPDQTPLHPRTHRPGHIVYEPIPDEQHMVSRALRVFHPVISRA
jgi:hypothetical protein